MSSSYFTLLHAAKLLQKRYARTVIADVYSQEKNTLSILLYAPEPHTITISCNPRENYIVAGAGDSRTRKNTVDLFPSLVDMHIESAYVSSTDRIVYLKISGNQWLCLEMFASKANVLLCSENGRIIDAFLNKKDLISTDRVLQLTEKEITVDEILPARDRFASEFPGNEGMLKALKKAVPKLGTTLAEEIIVRTTGNNYYDSTKNLVQEILSLGNVAPLVYFEEQSPVCFSLIPLKHLSSFRNETYDDVFSGIRKFISFERSTSSFLQKKKEITSWLSKELDKAERTIHAVETELAESSRAEQYDLYANLLMANLQSLSKGMRSVSLENSFSQSGIVNIPLDSSLSPQKNAGRYFEKAKKSKTGREESQIRLKILTIRKSSLKDQWEKINDINDSVSLKNFIHLNNGTLKELGFMTDKEQEDLPPFKIFTVEGGFKVYAGKNSANNDLLTFKFAKPNDLWFHARGSSGSHVVLKTGSANGTPSKKGIEQAAAIAAYYSKMKNAKHVPVAMTERKFVHKPRGASPGTVVLDKEKVIFVQPVLPTTDQ